jgi:hypothetical protein
MKLSHSLLLAIAGVAGSANAALAGWCWGDNYIGRCHDCRFNNRFLERPCPPYHGWNRPLYGWSSNYRPYYFTPQPYANTPWAYGPYHHATIYETAAPTEGLNAYGVPVQQTSSSSQQKSPYSTTPATPTYVPPATPTPAPPPPPMPEVTPPPPPQPSLK